VAPDLKALYASMLRIRMVEETIADHYAEQEMRCPVHLCIGQEAIAAGVCATLTPDDYVLSGHRAHGHYLAKGGRLPALIAELYGKATGCAGGKGGSMHLVDRAIGFLGSAPIVAATVPIAAGVAFGSLLRGEPRVTAVFFGDGAVEEGVLHETLNFAVLKRLPLVLVCENNLYSVYSDISQRQPVERSIAQWAQGYGLPAVQGDGNDCEAVARMAAAAVARARQGLGPSFLELMTYRWREHCGPDYDLHLAYRAPSEVVAWRARCPLARAREALIARRIYAPSELSDLADSIAAEIEAAVEFARNSPAPGDDLLKRDVYPD